MLIPTGQAEMAPPAPVEDHAQALMREARRRTRRRRTRRAAAIAVLIGIGAAAYATLSGGSGGVFSETASRPYANLHAFSDDGQLAFISRGAAWVLDGEQGTLRRLPAPAGSAPSSPVFSHDGRWLAYIVGHSLYSYGPSTLWIAHGNGTDAHPVRRLTVNQFIGWSPSADLVAVATGESKHGLYGSPTALDLVSPSGRLRTLFTRSTRRAIVTQGAIQSAVWSPSGRSLALSTHSPDRDSGTQILSVPVSGARPTVWLSIPNRQRLTGSLSCGPDCGGGDTIAQLAGWWPKRGIGFWVFSSGMTRNSDSTPLAAIGKPGAQPRFVAETLSDAVTDAVTASRSGELALVASGNAGRDYADQKTLEACSPSTFSCSALPGGSTWTGPPLTCKPCFNGPATGQGSAVSLDPAWSPDGTLLAYAKAPVYRAGGNPRLDWFQAHQLYLWDSQTGATRRIGTITGSELPTWSSNGKLLLYVSADGLWLADTAKGKAVEIEHPLYRESAWKQVGTTALSFYGQIPWSGQFSWHSS